MPNDFILQKTALSLLLIDSLINPIKNIIKNNKIDRRENILYDAKVQRQATFDLTNSEYLTELDKQNEDLMKHLKIDLTFSQKECIEMVLTNYVSIIYGPPGCGKTTMIGLLIYNLLKDPKRKILLCSQSNQAVENVVKFALPIVKAMNKQIAWITKNGICFDTQEDFENATEEQKCSPQYKIMMRETEEAYEYRKLQIKKWNINKFNKENRNYQNRRTKYFSMSNQNKMDEYQRIVEKNIINESHVVCCTLITSAKSNMLNFDFDCIIIDEASQASQLNSLIPLIHKPTKIVLVGDHQQLDASYQNDFVPTYPSTLKSLYLNLLEKNVQYVMLNTQFRMNRYISEFVNQKFYNGQIETFHETEKDTELKLRNILTPIMFVDVKDGYENKVEIGSTYKNIKEADVIETILYNLKEQGIQGNQVGVITPYRGQREILKNRPKSLGYKCVRISCVDSFQGTEKDIIIISFVRTNKFGEFGFITNKNRINVSLTRARKCLILVGNLQAIKNSNKYGTHPENEILIELCQFYEKQNAVVDSKLIRRINKSNEIDLLQSHHLSKLDDNKPKDDDDDDDDDELKPVDSDAALDDISTFCQNNVNENEKIEDMFGGCISYE